MHKQRRGDFRVPNEPQYLRPGDRRTQIPIAQDRTAITDTQGTVAGTMGMTVDQVN